MTQPLHDHSLSLNALQPKAVYPIDNLRENTMIMQDRSQDMSNHMQHITCSALSKGTLFRE